jgi:hypothetical protein
VSDNSAPNGARSVNTHSIALPACCCPDLDALSCYRNRHKLEPEDGDFLEEACECICHAENREDERDAEDARS